MSFADDVAAMRASMTMTDRERTERMMQRIRQNRALVWESLESLAAAGDRMDEGDFTRYLVENGYDEEELARASRVMRRLVRVFR